MERIQNKFKRWVGFKCKTVIEDDKLLSLKQRREYRDTIFLYKVLHDVVDSPYLLSKVMFVCPVVRLRSQCLFYNPIAVTKYSRNRFIVRSTSNYNKYYSGIDIFHLSLNKFIFAIKTNLKAIE